MKHILSVALSWMLAVLCAVGIFLLSAQTGSASAELSGDVMGLFGRIWIELFGSFGHTLLRKLAHFSAYCALMFFTYHACFRTRKQKRLHPVLPFILCVLYAASDEIHQYFVPERSCELFDVGIDSLGILVGGICFFLLAKLCLHRTKKKKEEAFS